ncbi:hypothetical protein D3C81_1885080 [compost metagenome]
MAVQHHEGGGIKHRIAGQHPLHRGYGQIDHHHRLIVAHPVKKHQRHHLLRVDTVLDDRGGRKKVDEFVRLEQPRPVSAVIFLVTVHPFKEGFKGVGSAAHIHILVIHIDKG